MTRWSRTGAAALAAVLGASLLGPVAANAADPAGSAVTGVDVSSWQHPNGKASDIDWTKVAGAGHSFAIVKATESTTYTNPYYASDVAAARSAGLIVGAYHFARPQLPLSTATAQAKYFVAVTGKMRTAKTLPPVLDIEVNGGLSKANTVAWATKFLAKVRTLTGRTPMIYSYDNFLRTSLANTTTLKGYPLWYASYSSSPPSSLPGGWNTWTIWQYSSQGSVAGMKGDIDVNRFNGSLSSLKSLADGTKAAPIVPAAPTDLTATLGWPDARLSWSTPSTNGGSPITNYAVSVDGGDNVSTPTTSFVATGLSPGTHTFSVRAVTIAGTGPAATTTLAVPEPEVGAVAAPAGSTTVALTSATTVKRGIAAALTVTLRRADTRQVLPAQKVTLTVKPRKGAKRTFTLVTTSTGTATAVLSHRATSTLSARYAGSARLNAAMTSTTVNVKPRIVSKLTSTKIKHGRTTRLKGNVHSLYAGERVYRQRHYGGAWHTLAITTVSSSGTFSFTIKPTVKGRYVYRVHMDASTLHLVGNSRTKVLRAT